MKSLDWDYPDHIVYQQLIDTRTWWNEELVNEFLITDKVVPNIHNASQTMRLFLHTQVREVETSIKFLERCVQLNRCKVEPKVFRKLKRRNNRKAKARRIRDKEVKSIKEILNI